MDWTAVERFVIFDDFGYQISLSNNYSVGLQSSQERNKNKEDNKNKSSQFGSLMPSTVPLFFPVSPTSFEQRVQNFNGSD